MKALLFRRTLVPAVAVMVLTIGGLLLAAPLYETSFVGTVGDQPTDWTVLAGTVDIDPSGEYRLDTGVALSHYTGAPFNNGMVEANFRKDGSYTGLAGRIQNASNFYHARLSGSSLQIYRFGGTGGTAPLASVSDITYSGSPTWKIQMTLLDKLITARLFNTLGHEVAFVSAIDDSFTSGTVGVRGIATSVWEDFQVSEVLVPEGLNVDIGLGPNSAITNDVQAGFQSFVGATTDSSPQSQAFLSDLGLVNQVSVNLSSSDLRFRDRGNVTHALGDLAEDFVFTYGSELDLTLDDLKPGRYQITTYHHDVSGVYGTMDLSVSDATRTSELVSSGLAITSGSAPTSIGQSTFSVISNGVDPVVVSMAKITGNFPMINGFETIAEETLNVDFGSSDHQVQAGFFDFSRSSDTSATETIASGLGVACTVDVGVSSVDGWQDPGNMSAIGLGDVAEDFVSSASRLELTLANLAAGQYVITTYHHDLGSAWDPFDIDVDDAFGSRIVAAGFTASTGTVDPALLTFTFRANGIDPVTIGFDTDASIAMLNGFSLALAIPEPSSLLLACLGLAAVGLVRRKRRR